MQKVVTEIPDDPSVVDTYTSDNHFLISSSDPLYMLTATCSTLNDREEALRQKAELLQQKGQLALACGALSISLDIVLALTYQVSAPVNHICPAFWLGLCLVGTGLSALTLAYRDHEELHHIKRKRPSRARIGYYFFAACSLAAYGAVAATLPITLWFAKPWQVTATDMNVIIIRLLVACVVIPVLALLWFVIARLAASRRWLLGGLLEEREHQLIRGSAEVFV